MSQLPLFDRSAAEDARAVALQRVARGTEPTFAERALEACRQVALTRRWFTSDEVWALLAVAGDEQPREPRAMGPIMLRAERAGWIAATGQTRNSDRVSNHRRPQNVWRSLLQ